MNVLTGLSRLMPTFDSDDIVDVLVDSRNTIRDGSAEVVKNCIRDTQNVNFSNNQEYQQTHLMTRKYYTKLDKNNNLFQYFDLILKDCDSALDALIPLVSKYFTKKVDKNSLTYQRGQIIALGETIDFVANIIPKICLYIIAKQTELSGGEKVEKVLSKAHIKYVKENLSQFYISLNHLNALDVKQMEKMIKEIPEVIMTDEGSEQKMFQKHKLDPTGTMSRFLSSSTNPFYYWRMWRVDVQHNKYKLAKEEVESIKIELEVMNAQLASGQVDAFLERQRELAIERKNKLEYQISKYEEEARNTRY